MKKSHTVKVDIETLKSLTLWEQVSLLLGSGYILGTLNIRSLTVSEWNLLGHSVSNNEGAYFPNDKNPHMWESIPFILMTEDGDRLDEYNLIQIRNNAGIYSSVKLTAWVRGPYQEDVFVMVPGESLSDEFLGNSCSEELLYTNHDLKYAEEELRLRHSKKTFTVIPLSNGRYALSTNRRLANTDVWTGIPTYGGGDIRIYHHYLLGTSEIAVYRVDSDSDMTFATEEDALKWASHIGIHAIKSESFAETAENKIFNKVDREELKNLTHRERASLLVKNGYKPENTQYTDLSEEEWKELVGNANSNYTLNDDEYFLRCWRESTPFVLKHGSEIIDKYIFVFAVCLTSSKIWNTKFWVDAFTGENLFMDVLDAGGDYNAQFFNVLPRPHEAYVYLNEAFLSTILSKQKLYVVRLKNGRYAITTTPESINAESWTGFPACGDGNIDTYSKALTHYGILTKYQVGIHDSCTFATSEAAFEWASQIGVEVTGVYKTNSRNSESE